MLIFSILLFLLLSALFSGSEIAFISASKLEVELKKMQGSRRGSILAKFYESPSDFLSTMLVGNNIALVVFTISLTKLMIDYGGEWLATEGASGLLLRTILITLVVLIFGEFLPKTLFRLYSNSILYALAHRPGVVKSRDALMDAAYDDQVYVDDRTIDSHIKRLRKKFKSVDTDFDMIETLYGVGYRFKE